MQIRTVLDFSLRDILFNALPMFHSFGFTVGMLTPILLGSKVILYPNPLHTHLIPAYIYDTDTTILLGTNAFLNGYQHHAAAFDFHRLRYVFSGAEKLSESVRTCWLQRFGIRILEGYGVTETSPALSFNTPMYHKPGSVGRLLPLIQHKLQPFENHPTGKVLWVKGPNILSGYHLADTPQTRHAPSDGWHNTGDVVTVDETGFITIVDRAKRFAKIAGEMVSLTAVEAACQRLWPHAEHAIIRVPAGNKGEALILMTTQINAKRTTLREHFKNEQLPEVTLPKQVACVQLIDKLGTGKINYPLITQQFIAATSLPKKASHPTDITA
jgi:acyl-[acyl-carrier-protein]-phospholipid O-acyltransferase / long-chain-fatty-acid--[acyl-carrier-protein] ligase